MTKLWRKEKSLVYALHPDRVPASGARLTYTFGLGGITVLSTLVTVVTGAALALYYVPTPDGAHDSVVILNDVVSYGSVVRGLHFWGAQWMVIAATLHMLRIVFTGGYRPPRELNWLIGLGLLVITLIWDFSGYVLRWDAGGYWALLVGTNLLREIPLWGETVYRAVVGDVALSAGALLRFYGWHVLGLTIVAALGIPYHLWRLRKDGGISRPLLQPGETRALISKDELFFREAIMALSVLALLVALAVVAPPDVGTKADPASSPTWVAAPWVLMWVQTLLRFLPPLWAGIVAPLAVLLVLAMVPFLDRRGLGRGVWLSRARWRVQALVLGLVVVLVLLSVPEVLR